MSRGPLRVRRLADKLAPDRTHVDAIDLNTLARSLGAVDVLYRTRALDGYTEWSDRGPVIQVALTRSDGRRRATLAHECAHLVFDPLVGAPGFREFRQPLATLHTQHVVDILGEQLACSVLGLIETFGIERSCDLMAFELLLPSAQMETWAGLPWDLREVTAAATRHRVSMALLIHRINECDGDLSLLRLQRNKVGTWLVPSTAGAPRTFTGRFTCPDTKDGPLENLPNRGGHTVLQLFGRGAAFEIPAEVRMTSSTTALAMCGRNALAASLARS